MSTAGAAPRTPTRPTFLPRVMRVVPVRDVLRSVWTSPRAAVRDGMQTDAARLVIAMAWLSGVETMVVNMAAGHSLRPGWGPFAVVLASTIGPLTALAYFGLAGALLAGIGRLLGGGADSSDTRVALACSVVPEVVALPLWVLAIGYYGVGLFTQEQDAMPVGVAVLLALSVALTVWGWILRVVMIAEVHDFTRWRSFATIVLSWLATIAVVVAIVAGLAALLPTNSSKG